MEVLPLELNQNDGSAEVEDASLITKESLCGDSFKYLIGVISLGGEVLWHLEANGVTVNVSLVC